MPTEQHTPSTDDLTHFTPFARAFADPDFVAGAWHPSRKVGPNVHTLPWWESSPAVSEWHQALYDRKIIDPESPYLTDEFAERMRAFTADPTLLRDQDLATIRCVLTHISRGDRFCEGLIAEMFENGVAQAATARLTELAR